MHKIELVKGIHSSVLGFGCAPVMGSVGAKDARRAIELAIELGINHFDLARSYGFGEAEEFVGKLLKGRRNKMVIASKFGIEANWKARVLRPVKPLIRMVKKRSVPVTPVNNAHNSYSLGPFMNRVEITAQEMRKNLEKSLKALGTEYLDYYFVHEPIKTISAIEEVIETAINLKTEGKIRAFGLSFSRNLKNLHVDYLDLFDILQFNISPGVDDYQLFVDRYGNKANILFSPFRGGDHRISPEDKLKSLLTSFSKSVILCSMFNPNHLNANVAAIK